MNYYVMKNNQRINLLDIPTINFESLRAQLIATNLRPIAFFGSDWGENIKLFVALADDEKGDILVYMGNDKEDRGRTTFQTNPVTITVMVFDGSKLIATTTKNGETTYKVYDETEIGYQLLRAFDYEHDLFFNLRPSQLVD